jgi:tripartite ATP-independent transporter DctP family solute receptor
MKTLKRVDKTLLILGLFLSLSLPNYAFAKVQLKFAHENNTSSAIQLQVEIFKHLVEERTKGEVEIAIYPGGTLTSSPEELMEFLREGAVDFSLTSTGNVSGFLADLQFINLPFLFKNPQHLKSGLQSYPVRKILDELEKKVGVKAVGLCEDGTGTCITSKKPINSFADMKGFKIRCMMNPIFIDMYKAFGAAPTPIDWGELYTSLKMNAVEGQDNAPYLSYTTGFFEAQDSVAMTFHYWSGFVFLMSPKKMKSLTLEQRQIIEGAAKETLAFQVEWCHLNDQKVLKALKKQGKTVTHPDMAPFIKASKPVYDKWFAKYPHWKAWFDQIQELNPVGSAPKAGIPSELK